MKWKMDLSIKAWICYAVGYVFIASGILKFLDGSFKGLFIQFGLPFPETALLLVAVVELGCGMLIISRMYLKLAVPPLILIMLGAIYITKIPVLLNESFLRFAFEARLDIVMLILLLLIWNHRSRYHVAGN
ncbi:DoxX family protein [Virgibacillus sp. YIM 98842]|uniref:DoxX family protein n=1 Tax=Virgibacillus sp. YIM 98842 TaxID=2663533 RepID=UPI001F09F30C|nr:DoxX family protein [Virgibacillus sp. YIM 98842]